MELLESSGLPNICVTMALEEEQHLKLGEALAAAVKVMGNLLDWGLCGSVVVKFGLPSTWLG